MNKRLIYSEADGTLAVVMPAPKARMPDESNDDFLDRVAARVVPAGSLYSIVATRDLPQERHFRNAWRKNGSNVVTDMPAAREIHRNNIRIARAAKLAQLDVDYMRADEAGNSSLKASIATQKQQLRDAPADSAIDAASTPEDLKAIWPSQLSNPYTSQ